MNGVFLLSSSGTELGQGRTVPGTGLAWVCGETGALSAVCQCWNHWKAAAVLILHVLCCLERKTVVSGETLTQS